MSSRRSFLKGSPKLALAAGLPALASAAPAVGTVQESISLNGPWRFRLDAEAGWRPVTVPHTWQTAAATAGYYGVAWYEREFDVPGSWEGSAIRIEFEAVFHSATVWVNNQPAGSHLRKGYTAFTLDITSLIRCDSLNTIRVRADNNFDDRMLPRGRSSDWAHDGGIYRPVRLLATAKTFIERVEIDAEPDPDRASGRATLNVRAIIRNAGSTPSEGSASLAVHEEASGREALHRGVSARYKVESNGSATIDLPSTVIHNAKLWHFDHPNLYTLRLTLSSGHILEETFGIRKIETRDGAFFLNGEKVRLMGVERMAGSNPEFGMAEPATWLDHDNADMKELNCVYTRVHWQQDRRLLDWCDRHGMFIQTEVPGWGGATFREKTEEPAGFIMQNGLEQLREMIARDRNHPCIFSWGMSNEINGQNPPAYAFVKRMLEESKKLDPKRLVTYASHSLQKTPEKDVAGLMDYVMWNEYYESWLKGTPDDLARNLDEIHAAFPNKAIVISEYGYCACTPDRPENDPIRIGIMRGHDSIFRKRDWVAGLIFFCYNDYRTHVGDKGAGVMKQRVHGVVDLYGAKKPSWEALRAEASPVESISASGSLADLTVTVKTRSVVPAYILRGYTLRAVAYGAGDIPVERLDQPLADLPPGAEAVAAFKFTAPGITRVHIDVMRPTGFSALTELWKP